MLRNQIWDLGSGIRCLFNSKFGIEKFESGSATWHVNYTASGNRFHDFRSKVPIQIQPTCVEKDGQKSFILRKK
jgi:hypothetical protein